MTNGEKYKTAQERAEEFDKYCDKRCRSEVTCSVVGCRKCLLDWLDLETEEEEPLPCPFCGSNRIYVHGGFGERYHVHCCSCGYSSRLFEKYYDAIAAHNRVAKVARESEGK